MLLWSTGFIGAKFGIPYAEPFSFLTLRFAGVAVVLALCCLVRPVRWPARAIDWWHLLVVGIVIHGIYLGGVFAAIDQGLGAGLIALIVGMQPIVTASLVGRVLGERVRPATWFGLALGFVGVVMVVANTVDWSASTQLGLWLAGGALAGLSLGVVYQKRFCENMDLLSGSCVQFVSATAFCAVLSYAFESRVIIWDPSFIFAMAWLVIVLSFGAMSLLWMLIRRGAASSVSSLFYLVPGVVAIEAWLLFDERLTGLALCGFAVAGIGVWQVNRTSR